MENNSDDIANNNASIATNYGNILGDIEALNVSVFFVKQATVSKQSNQF